MAEKYAVGIYKTENEVVSAIDRLLEIGYEHDEISVLARDPERFEGIKERTDIPAESPKATARGAGAGVATGGVLGGVGALLLSLGTLAIPGVGPFLAAGPIVATLSGIAAGGAVGGVIGALVGLGFDKEEARNYESALDRGEILVLVRADADRHDNVHDIFRYPEDEYYLHYERRTRQPVPPLGTYSDPEAPLGSDGDPLWDDDARRRDD